MVAPAYPFYPTHLDSITNECCPPEFYVLPFSHFFFALSSPEYALSFLVRITSPYLHPHDFFTLVILSPSYLRKPTHSYTIADKHDGLLELMYSF